MPPDPRSLRRRALDGMVTVLQTITQANGYGFNLAAAGQVSKTVDTIEGRKASGLAITLRVADGPETYRWMSQQRQMEADLEIQLHALMLGLTAEDMVDQANDLIRDIHKAIDAHRDLMAGAAINEARITEIDAPQYDLANSAAAVLMHVSARYDYQAGTTI